MEVVITVFIGCWLSAAGILAYRQMKKEFGEAGDQKGGAKR